MSNTSSSRSAGRRSSFRGFALAAAIAALLAVAGCAASQAYSRGTEAAKANEWDVAVDQFRKALQAEPKNSQYRIALVRAMTSASQYYAEQGRLAEARGQMEQALVAFRRANEFDPSNRVLAAHVSDLEKKLRELAEAGRPKTNIDQMREAARQTGPVPFARFNEVLSALQFNAPVRDILTQIGVLTGVNITFERLFVEPRPMGYTLTMDGLTLEQALNTITSSNGLFYKVLTQNTLMIINDTPQNRQAYEDQVLKVLRLSNADATEVAGLIAGVVRIPGAAGQATFTAVANKTQNTITVRAPANILAIIERYVEITDKPRAEVVVDVEILEVNRRRVQQYGLDLGDYAIGVVFSPEANPITGGALVPQPFNAATLRGGINLSDFYLAVPAATIRFLETDSETKLLARPQLRGAEGQELQLELGEEIPIPTTTFTPLAAGGANVNPLSSYAYRAVGVILRMTPRVTYDDNIVLQLQVENSARTGDTNVGGTIAPVFATRRASATLRLRDGESNLLAGLVQEGDRRSLRGIPGILRLPVIKQLFTANDNTIEQTDVIILLTPRIVRSHELRQIDLDPMFIGTANNLSLGGPAPLVAQPAPAPAPAAQPPAPGAQPPAPGAQPPAPGAGGAPGAAGGAAAAQPPAATPPAAATQAPPLSGATQISLMPQSTEVRQIGQSALLVPIGITGTRLSSVTLTVTYNPAVLRVRTVQQSSFMGSSGGPVAFSEDHATPGRIDIVLLRANDTTGANGVGTLAALLFDTIAQGPANFTITGTATAPGGAPLTVQFAPAPAVTVK